ncbi:MAG: type II toxin-antitoxin system HicA family toxin [Prevotellaceae bacterium]|nr:type II toxin-antitoxin system HicA family toxin [Prevotellaceae bacterium]
MGQDSTSHRDYEKHGIILRIPYHGSKEVPTGTCKKILKALGVK